MDFNLSDITVILEAPKTQRQHVSHDKILYQHLYIHLSLVKDMDKC